MDRLENRVYLTTIFSTSRHLFPFLGDTSKQFLIERLEVKSRQVEVSKEETSQNQNPNKAETHFIDKTTLLFSSI